MYQSFLSEKEKIGKRPRINKNGWESGRKFVGRKGEKGKREEWMVHRGWIFFYEKQGLDLPNRVRGTRKEWKESEMEVGSKIHLAHRPDEKKTKWKWLFAVVKAAESCRKQWRGNI